MTDRGSQLLTATLRSPKKIMENHDDTTWIVGNTDQWAKCPKTTPAARTQPRL